MASEAQIAANRANAQKSTGPRTEVGRARAAMNGLKHGMCSREAVLEWEDRESWDALLADLRARWRPVGPQEEALVEEYAGCSWRLRRAMQMETGMLRACWPNRLQELADSTDDGIVLGMAMDTVGLGMAFMKASKELSRLSLHESRIERRRERARKELEALQTLRRRAEAEAAATAEAEAELASDSQGVERTLSPAGAEEGVRAPQSASDSRPHPGPNAGHAAWTQWLAGENCRLDRQLASDSRMAA